MLFYWLSIYVSMNVCLIVFRGHINVISSCCFSKDEHFLATGSWDKNIQIWDIATGVYRYSSFLMSKKIMLKFGDSLELTEAHSRKSQWSQF